MNKLTTNQKVAIELGMRQRKGLIRQTKRMAKKVKSTTAKYVDQLIAGPSGTGKSFNILKTLRSEGLQFFEMTGNASIFGFMGNLLYLHSQKPFKKHPNAKKHPNLPNFSLKVSSSLGSGVSKHGQNHTHPLSWTSQLID